MAKLEHVCENCDNSKIETDIEDQQYCVCKLGSEAFIECQVAGTDDHFERRETK